MFQAFKTGIGRVNKKKRMVLLLYGINILFAILLTIPFHALLQSFFSDSLMTEKILQGFDFDAFTDFMRESKRGIDTLTVDIFWFALFYLLFNTFLAGGILEVFYAEERRFSTRRFFSGCATYFGRFLRLLMFSVIFFLAVFILNTALSALVSAITDDTRTEVPWIIWKLVQYLIVFLLLCFVNMIFDYAKIKTVVEDSRKMMRTTFSAIGFIFQHPGKTLGLFYLLVLIAILLLVIYLLLENLINTTTAFGILLLFVLQQIYMFVRFGVRASFFSTQLALFERLMPQPMLSAAGAKRTIPESELPSAGLENA